jgi:hypothetical protein
VWEYSDNTIEPEGKIMVTHSGPTHDLWNRSWTGYNGATPFEWVFEAQPNRLPPADFVDLGVTYMATTRFQMDTGDYSSSEIRAWIDRLYLLKVIHFVPGDWWPQDLYMYRLLPPQVAANVTFGEAITLSGYDISQTTITAGETLHLRSFWNAVQKPAVNYNIFVHLYANQAVGEIVAQHDGPPAKSSRPTSTWDDPDEFIPGSLVSLIIPTDIPAGDYTLALGLYDYTSGVRLTTNTGEDKLAIPLRVQTVAE